MTPFTDDDLARIRGGCTLSAAEYGNKDAEDILALIARLEAAEMVCQSLWETMDMGKLEAWRKAAGK
jgi:hypothetical protein